MRPDGIAITRICLTLSGIEKIDVVNVTILVMVILGEIYQRIGKRTSLSYKLLQTGRIIYGRALVGSILRIFLR